MINFLNKPIKIYLVLRIIFFINKDVLIAFDYDFYINRHRHVPEGAAAFFHYLGTGFNQGLQSAKAINNTNFDWRYYVNINGLNINCKSDAKAHYKAIGKKQNLKYCKNFKICINLHLYNLGLLDEFISKINYFMKINKLNTFYIKINVPIWDNIDDYKKNKNLDVNIDFDDKIFNQILNLTPHHKELVTRQNYQVLYDIFQRLRSCFNIDKDRVQVIFSENRGVDIGGFLLLNEQILSEKLDVDYIVVLHSKTHDVWRQILTSILKLKVNKLLNYYDYIDACNFVTENPCKFPHFSDILDYFNLPYIDKIHFSLGTTFIVSYKLIEFFRSYNIVNIFDQLSFADAFHRNYIDTLLGYDSKYEYIDNYNLKRGITREHAYTRFLGYLVSYLGLKQRVIDYIA